MNQIDTISNDANQLIRFVLDDGTTVSMSLVYRPAIQRWTVDVVRNDFEADGINVSAHPNFMRPWVNVVPFGIACTSTDGGDPVYIDDFVNGRCALYVLDQADVAAVEADIGAS